jgi:large subunit ribosomal protein L25
MSDTVSLKAQKRDLLGKKVKHLRRDGLAPAVIHDHGKESIHICIPMSELHRVLHGGGKHHPVTVKLDGGKEYMTLIKEVTYEPASSKMQHAVFQAVRRNQKVTADIPIQLVDDSPGVISGLQLVTQANSVEVEAFPNDLPEAIVVSISELKEAGEKITVADLKVPENVLIKGDETQLVAALEAPVDQVAEADAALEEAREDQAIEETTDEPEADSETSEENSES